MSKNFTDVARMFREMIGGELRDGVLVCETNEKCTAFLSEDADENIAFRVVWKQKAKDAEQYKKTIRKMSAMNYAESLSGWSRKADTGKIACAKVFSRYECADNVMFTLALLFKNVSDFSVEEDD